MPIRGVTPVDLSVKVTLTDAINASKRRSSRKRKVRRIALSILGVAVGVVVVGMIIALIILLKSPFTTTTAASTSTAATTNVATTLTTGTTVSTTSVTTTTTDTASTTTTTSATTATTTTTRTTSVTTTTTDTASTTTTTTTTSTSATTTTTSVTTTTTATTTTTVTTATTATTSTSATTSTTSTSSTTSTTSTSTTTSTSRTTSTTSTSTTTSTTSTSSTTSTTSTSTTTSTTSTTTTTRTTSTTTTTTTTPIPCVNMAWNSTGTTIAGTSGTAGSAANQFNQPWNLFVDTNYNIYVADAGNHRIQYWAAGASTGTTVAGTTGVSGSAATQLNQPSDIFVTSSGNLYVADRGNNRIQYFASGSSTGIAVSTGWGGIGSFRGVQVDSSGFIYGSDTSNNALWKNNTVPLGYAGAGGGSNQLNGNQGIALDTTINPGYVYIANANQHTIVQWALVNNVGNVVAGTNGVLGSSSTTMAYPVGVRIDPLGNLFVVDNNNHRIQLYCRYPTIATTARTLVGTGTLGSTSTQFNYPTGMALDKDLNLYVADTGNHRIQKFIRTA